MKTVIKDRNEIAKLVAESIKHVLKKKSDAVIAFSCGESMNELFEILCEMCIKGELSFKNARILAITEFLNAGDKSCRARLENELIRKSDARLEYFFVPDCDNPQTYDELISELGGIDFAVLGIGVNAHIGYNEPATPFDTRTHVQKLTDRTKKQLLSRGFTLSNMPDYAVTMGIHSIVEARQIALIAFGEEKAEAVFQMVYGKTVTYIPASFLQIPLEVTAYIDTAAAAKL